MTINRVEELLARYRLALTRRAFVGKTTVTSVLDALERLAGPPQNSA